MIRTTLLFLSFFIINKSLANDVMWIGSNGQAVKSFCDSCLYWKEKGSDISGIDDNNFEGELTEILDHYSSNYMCGVCFKFCGPRLYFILEQIESLSLDGKQSKVFNCLYYEISNFRNGGVVGEIMHAKGEQYIKNPSFSVIESIQNRVRGESGIINSTVDITDISKHKTFGAADGIVSCVIS